MTAPFSINRQTGQVRFPDLDLELRPLMPQSEFIAVTAAMDRDNLSGNDGWQRYTVRSPISQDRKLGLFLIFINGRLKILTIAYAGKDESWATWSEEGEREREEEYQAELAAQLGGGNTFSWGKVRLQPDTKGGGSDIWMEFSDPSVADKRDCSRT